MKKKLKCKAFIFIIAFFIIFIVFPSSTKADDDKKSHFCLICSSDEKTHKMEKQFVQRIKIIKSILGDSIDEVALAATVLHKEDALEAVKNRYEEKFKEDDYKKTMEALFKGEETEPDEAEGEATLGTKSGVTYGQVDLLNAAAIIMADSAGWGGKYNEEAYQKALAGDKLLNSAPDIVNNIFCTLGAAGDGIFTVNNVTYQFATGQDVLSEINRTITRWNNMDKICKNGYIGGVYDLTPESQPDAEKRQLQKDEIAEEIINLIKYYRLIADSPAEEEDPCVADVNGDLTGHTQAADLIGKSREKRIEIIGPIAQAVYAKTGVYASATIAQLIKESGIGEAYDNTAFIKQNNLGGVKCRTGRKCANGYAVFDSLEDALMDRAKMFDNGMYPNWRKHNSSPHEFLSYFVPIYCPVDDGCDPDGYVADADSFIKQYDLKKYDKKSITTTANQKTLTKGTTAAYANWKQYEGDWKGIKIGNGRTMSQIGCLVTSSAIQIARSGTKITKLPKKYSSFDPGALVTALNKNDGFAGESLKWNKLNVVASNWKYDGQVHFKARDNKTLASKVAAELKTPAKGKYQKFLILELGYEKSKGTGDHSDEHWVAVNEVKNGEVQIFDPGASGVTLDDNYTGWYVKGYAVLYATDVEFGKIGVSTDANGDLCNVDLNYDYEKMYSASEKASVSPNSPATDLAKTQYKNVDGFNKHIKDCVQQAGYGTRAGVVAAAKCLISDYIESTGHRMRYSMPQRGNSSTEGISDDTYFDCSSFGWWALYNGGFKLPSPDTTPYQLGWAQGQGIARKNYRGGQPGDYLIYDEGGGAFGHNRLIIGTHDNGYYIAEFTGSGGGQITKTSYDGIEGKYYLIDMKSYYENKKNVR